MPMDRNRQVQDECEARNTALLDEIEDGYVEMDLAGDIVLVNRAFRRIFGYPNEKIQRLTLRNHYLEEDFQSLVKIYNKVLKTGIPGRGIVHEITSRDGTKRILENSVSLKRNSEGVPTGFRSLVRDITDRKRAEEELAGQRSRLQAIFSSVDDAIITVDPAMRVLEANKATEKICGVSCKKIIGKVFSDCLNRCQKSCHGILNDVLQSKTVIRGIRIECGLKDLGQQTVNVTASPLLDQDGQFMGAVLVIRDISRLSKLEKELGERYQFQNIIGKSSRMQEIFNLLEDLSDVETTVLITGESGTGKELVAKALHYSGSRKDKPLVKVNCSALAENLLESELFGHVKGAFTGAIKDRQGRFQAAHGGTILLDEIGDISPRIQSKLLRVLQEMEFERVGDSEPIKVDVRVITATNQDLKEKIKTGEFRKDLYYRLKVVEIVLPPLRERPEDIPLMADHFRSLFNNRFNKQIEKISDEVHRCFLKYSWPGNVRELEHAMERAFVFCNEPTITPRHIPLEIVQYPGKERSFSVNKPDLLREEILAALNRTDWNKSKAARLLGIGRRSLYRKIELHNLTKPADLA